MHKTKDRWAGRKCGQEPVTISSERRGGGDRRRVARLLMSEEEMLRRVWGYARTWVCLACWACPLFLPTGNHNRD